MKKISFAGDKGACYNYFNKEVRRMNQGDEIISKAEAMGINTGSSSNIDDRLKVIASEVGLDTFDPDTDPTIVS